MTLKFASSLARSRIAQIAVVLAVLVIGGLVLSTSKARAAAVDMYENIAYAIDPSAARAFQYGERHFNARESAEYDIDRAEYFFDRAAAQDPTLPYLYHELARISFLRGDFGRAMAQIDFQISMHGDSAPNSYYVRGLIEGYAGAYDASIADYQRYLQFDPHNWAAINDYCWVLLKADRAHDAAVASAAGLALFPNNPWLLNTSAIALYESGDIAHARDQMRKALIATQNVTPAQWLVAYPGNDPRVADIGVAAFQNAARENMHSIALAAAIGAVQSMHQLHE